MALTRELIGKDMDAAVLADGLGVGWVHAVVLMTLMAHPEGLTSAQLCYLCDPSNYVKLGALQERISFLRKVMGRDAIGGYASVGDRTRGGCRASPTLYTITPDGRRQCEEAVAKATARLRLRFAMPELV